MSDRLITAEEARNWLDRGGDPEDPFAEDLARKVIAQAEQIKRLQKAVAESEVIFWEVTGHDLEQQLERKGVQLEHDDMEER